MDRWLVRARLRRRDGLRLSELGAGLFVGLIVTSSTVTSLLLDHFGWLGFAVHPTGFGRIAGALLMVAGVSLIAALQQRGPSRTKHSSEVGRAVLSRARCPRDQGSPSQTMVTSRRSFTT